MIRILKITLIISLLVTGSSIAQITISTGDMVFEHGSVIESAQHEEDYVTVDVGPAGANQTWNFTAMVTPVEYSEHWIDPAGTAGGASFPNATGACFYNMMPDLYYYYETTQSNHLMIGAYTAVPVPLVMPTNNLVTPDNFPLTYQDSWMGVTEAPSPFGGADVVDTTWGEVDAWGTVVDITGSFDCLRVKTHSKSWSMVGGIPTNEMEHWLYYWYTPGRLGTVVMMSQPNETNPNFTLGNFVRTIGVTGIKELPSWTAMPTEVNLQPAFPNPFNPETNLTFSLPMAGDITLSIYDSQGRLVSNLQNGWMTPGSYQANFSADHLSSGTYFARLTSGNTSQMQKLVLVK